MVWGQDEEKRECCYCQEMRPCEWVADPYIKEIDGAAEVDWWCEECYNTRSGDI